MPIARTAYKVGIQYWHKRDVAHNFLFSSREIKEKGMLIDWENAADLTSQAKLSEFANRTVSFISGHILGHSLLCRVHQYSSQYQ